jgi:hypothetical protein
MSRRWGPRELGLHRLNKGRERDRFQTRILKLKLRRLEIGWSRGDISQPLYNTVEIYFLFSRSSLHQSSKNCRRRIDRVRVRLSCGTHLERIVEI